jgi:uncharacterized delta-60 repeat protein
MEMCGWYIFKMSQKVKVGGVWKDARPYLKVGGSWKVPQAIYNKFNGEWKNSFLAGGVNDSSFTTYDVYTGINSNANSIAIKSDGKIILAGDFIKFNEISVNDIIRLNSDGTLDTDFLTNIGTGPNFSLITKIFIQSDGKIIVGGSFTTWNGVTVNRIVRLNSDGTRDTTFTTNAGTAANSVIRDIAVQSDGKIIIVGGFTSWNSSDAFRVVRLNSDGTRDADFTTGVVTGPNGAVQNLALQPDGKILLGGEFTQWNSVTVNRIVRLNSDGTRDTTFTTNTGTASNGIVYAIAVQSDGKIILGGLLTTWNGVTVNRIVRLNSDGTRDTTFTTNAGTALDTGSVSEIAIQSDGKIIVVGDIPTWNGTVVNNVVCLNSDGTRNTTFTTNTGTAANISTTSIAIQSDGKIVIGGFFTAWNGSLVNRIVRLNSNGSRDSFFILNRGYAANSSVESLAVQSDEKILVGGSFTTWNDVTVNRVARLFSDGTLDILFTINAGTGANSLVLAIATQSDGKIILGGSFTTFNGTTVNRIVRLNSDGSPDTAFTTNTGSGANSQVNAISIQSDGKIILAGHYISSFNGVAANKIVRLNSDGTRDTTFTANIGTGADDLIFTVDAQSDGKILVGGRFANWNGTAARGIVRLNSNGTQDTTFATNLGAGSEVNFVEVFSTFTRSDGKALVSASFTTVTNSGFISLVTTKYLVVLANLDGTLDTNFSTNIGTEGADSNIYDMKVQEDGKILLGGFFSTWNFQPASRVLRLNSDGTQDIGFTTKTGTGASGQVNAIAIQSDQKIIIGGNFTNFNGIVRSGIARLSGDFAG